jgi:hypothetical protein
MTVKPQDSTDIETYPSPMQSPSNLYSAVNPRHFPPPAPSRILPASLPKPTRAENTMAKKSNPKSARTIKVVSDDSEVSTPAGEPKINKSEEIRVEARRLLDAGAKLAPKLIIEKLAARGIEVVSPQVSQVLKKEGYATRPGKNNTKPKTADPKLDRKKTTKTSSGSFTVEELKAANKFFKTIGDAARAVELMDAMFGE